MIFVITEIVVYYRYRYSFEKEQVNESPSIDSIAPRTSIRTRQSGRTGIEGVTFIMEIKVFPNNP